MLPLTGYSSCCSSFLIYLIYPKKKFFLLMWTLKCRLQTRLQWVCRALCRLKKKENFAHPLAKTPVPNRKNKASEAPKMSPPLSGLTPNVLGSGGLKFGGGEKLKDPPPPRPAPPSSLALTEVVPSGVLELDGPDVALTEKVALGLRRHESGGKTR